MRLFHILIVLSVVLIGIPPVCALDNSAGDVYHRGVVSNVSSSNDPAVQNLDVKLTTGEDITVVANPSETGKNINYAEGDRVIVQGFHINDTEVYSYIITDFDRLPYLFISFVIFVVLSLLVGKIYGLNSLFGMAFSFLVIFKYILPQIISGKDPVLVTIIASVCIIPVTFYLSHGFNKKTHTAIVSTVLTLIMTALLTSFAVHITKLTGYSSDEAMFLQMAYSSIDMRGILLAGIIIGFLGVLDDVTVSQASIVSQLSKSKDYKNFMDLYSDAMEVGRDHITSMINTLVLVYAGASMPLLLLFVNNPQPVFNVLNAELIADEVVRTLLGSIGLILAVPISTFISAIYTEMSK